MLSQRAFHASSITEKGEKKGFQISADRKLSSPRTLRWLLTITARIALSTHCTGTVWCWMRVRQGLRGSAELMLIASTTAHEVRNISTKRHQAVNAVTAQHRWCLTGTPIQNTLDDLAALVAFLKVPILEERHKFRKFITPHSGVSAASRYQSLRTLLRTICLRRTREVLNIPEPNSRTREVLLTENERAEYNAVIERSKELVDMSVSKRGTRTLNAAVLESLLRLRLFCNNGPAGITYSDTDEMPTDPDEMLSYLQQCDKADCVYCKQMIYSLDKGGNTEGALRIPACEHLVCYQCMGHFRQDGKRCPSENCAGKDKDTTGARKDKTSSAKGLGAKKKQKLDSAISTHAYPYAPGEAPSKLKACLDDIESEMSPFSKPKWYVNACQTFPASMQQLCLISTFSNSIVFSSWTKTLYLVGHLLFRRDIPFEMIHGSLSVTTRIENLKKFQSQMGPNVLLMTLGTGAVGYAFLLAFISPPLETKAY
jgi:SWI/SNF-related matrix-associated actin-dependent regulator of chromatin subfamily A3